MRRVTPFSPLPIMLALIAVGGASLLAIRAINRSTSVPLPVAVLPTPTPTPKAHENSWPSPDGSMVLLMRKTVLSSTQTTYELWTHTQAKPEVPTLVFSSTVGPSTSYRIPYNSWSPDNKLFYVEQTDSSGIHYLVLKGNGQEFGKSGKSLDVGIFFTQKLPKLTMKNVTGWASPTLLIVNAVGTPASSDGPSYWFDTTRNSFIRLSDNFN